MALDLYANFERTENSSIFYRLTSPAPYNISLKLLDTEITPQDNITPNIIAEYSLNGGTPYLMRTKCSSFVQNLTFNSTFPSLCTISITIKDSKTLVSDRTYTMQVRFVSAFPVANFAVFPTNIPYKDPSTGNVFLKSLDETTYTQSSGTSFYGEGHSEEFNVIRLNSSSAVIDEDLSSETPIWFVGNPIHTLLHQSSVGPAFADSDSFLPVTTQNNIRKSTVINTTPNDEATYPVSLFVYDGVDITPDSPIVTYNDSTGLPEYYPFFYSTQSINGNANLSNTILKDTIKVLKYPSTTSNVYLSSQLYSPLEIYLPLDSTQTIFNSLLIYSQGATPPVITQTFMGSWWNTHAVSNTGEWGGDGDVITNTGFLPSISSYNFPLMYDNKNNGFLDYYMASPVEDTTVTLTVSSYVNQVITTPVINDWIPKTSIQEHTITAIIKALPFGKKLFTPNYYNLINQPVKFQAITNANQTQFKILNLTITSPSSPETLVITQEPYVGTMKFNKLGKADINAVFTTLHIPTNTQNTIDLSFTDMINIVHDYDDVDERYYYTENTVLKIPPAIQPRLSPNEWVTADNVNNLIEKLYNATKFIDEYAYRYQQFFCFYGWLGLASNLSPLAWQDVECPVADENQATWASKECYKSELCSPVANGSSISNRWSSQVGVNPNPNCVGKYCIEWKWNLETSKFKDNCITWTQAKCLSQDGVFGTKWKNDVPCSFVSELNCTRESWKICNIDPEYFPLNNCNQSSYRCDVLSVIPYEKTDSLIFVYPTEVQLIENDYSATMKGLHKNSDMTNLFQNIVGASLGPNGDLYVLDSILSRVTVLQIINDDFHILDTWGNFGYKNTVGGVNNPNDIHVDQNNVVWIADTGNKCVKKFMFSGKELAIIQHDDFASDPPRSVCIDSTLKVHVLLKQKVMVFNYSGAFLFAYNLYGEVKEAYKINTNYNRECVYISYGTGIVKYFRTGIIAYALGNNHQCSNGEIITKISSSHQDSNRNVYITAGDKILKIADLMKIQQLKANSLFQQPIALEELLIHEEEYIQPWVYLKSFHRLWDVVELVRSSLFYEQQGCKVYKPAIHEKQKLVLGQNEIVSSAVVNRLGQQIWENIETLFTYFDPVCNKQDVSLNIQFQTTCCASSINDAPQEIKC